MNTEMLIRSLAADAARPVVRLGPLVAAALIAGGALSLALFNLLFDPRPDFSTAIRSHAFPLKLLIVACLAVAAAGQLLPMARPLPTTRILARLAVAPLLLLMAVLVELCLTSPGEWYARMVGRNSLHCLGGIPLLSVPPALLLFVAMRRGAPARAPGAGAVVGLAASGIGGCLYAVSCPDDSPLFVALWYSLAIGFTAAICALAGNRWLRW